MTRTRRITIPDRGSKTMQCLEVSWRMLQEEIPGLPSVVISTVEHFRRRKSAGHFVQAQWKARAGTRAHEVAVNPDLFEDQKELLGTLLHEAAHAILFEEDPLRQRHNAGCSLKDPYYHLDVFRKKAIALGLNCEFHNRRYGFEQTSWPNDKVQMRYRPILDYLRRNMPKGTETRVVKPHKTKGGFRVAWCKCKTPVRIYINFKKIDDLLKITCSCCESRFHLLR